MVFVIAPPPPPPPPIYRGSQSERRRKNRELRRTIFVNKLLMADLEEEVGAVNELPYYRANSLVFLLLSGHPSSLAYKSIYEQKFQTVLL